MSPVETKSPEAAAFEKFLSTRKVLVADPSADPWWNRMPTVDGQVKLTPLSGTPEQIATGLLGYASERITHVQIALDPMRPDTVEALAPVLEYVDRMIRR